MARGALIRVRGQVQGVGFRPHVWRVAQALMARGEVLNDAEGVLIRVMGDGTALAAALRQGLPPLARIDAVEIVPADLPEMAGFSIAASGGPGAETPVTPDAAFCAACATEIRDPAERRFGYAFTNCTHCGPRYTILRGLPYDRAQTTMAGFAMCADCAADYGDPADRRFLMTWREAQDIPWQVLILFGGGLSLAARNAVG